MHDDRTFFEFLTLEGAQAGLSWETILKKRDNYRKAFDNFDVQKVARYTPARIERLLQNPGVVRNRLKIESTIQNAKAFLEVQKEFGSFDAYVWQFVGGRPRVNRPKSLTEIPASTPEADALSRDLRKRGEGVACRPVAPGRNRHCSSSITTRNGACRCTMIACSSSF